VAKLAELPSIRWVLIAFTIIGIFVLIYWYCERGPRGPNRYGPV